MRGYQCQNPRQFFAPSLSVRPFPVYHVIKSGLDREAGRIEGRRKKLIYIFTEGWPSLMLDKVHCFYLSVVDRSLNLLRKSKMLWFFYKIEQIKRQIQTGFENASSCTMSFQSNENGNVLLLCTLRYQSSAFL